MINIPEQARELLRYLVEKLPTVVPGKPETYVGYKQVHEEMRLPKIGPRYGSSLQIQGLNDLAELLSKSGAPGITGLIIDKAKKSPGKGYFNLYNKNMDDTLWWNEQIKKAKKYDWSRYLAVDVKADFEHWLIRMGKKDKTAKNYSGAITGSLTRWSIENNIATMPLIEVNDARTIIDIASKLQGVETFKQSNERGGNMYSCALKSYAEYLRDKSNEQIETDISEIVENDEIDITEKSTLISARIGQGRYRQQLIELWKGCALTGYQDVRFLVASHIKPWRESNNQEKLDPYNGLLLLPNVDKVFDLGYISFSEKGKIIISSGLEDAYYLGIKKDMRLNVKKGNQLYLEYHRDKVFKS